MKFHFGILALLLALPLAGAAQDLNFYLPGDSEQNKKTESETADKKPSVKSTPKPSATPESSTSRSTRKPAPSTDLPRREPTSRGPSNFDPPLDEFGLARAFQNRWDFSTFLITGEEELRFRINAARTRTLRIARAFSSLSNEVEVRQRNLDTAALAAYLLSRDQATWNPLGGRNLTEAQLLAVRATMRHDINAMDNALDDYEILRNSLNQSAEELAALDEKGLAGAQPNALADADRPTLPYTAVARAQTSAVLDERIISIETLKAILASERLSDNSDRRQSLASFAPPPPMVHQRVAPSFAPAAPPPRNLPTHDLKRPEQTAVILPADTNAPVHVVRDGIVAYAGPFRGYGSVVIVEHEKGTFTIYSHLATVLVRERQPIKTGTIIGRAGIPPELGRTGVHFQIRKGKEVITPADWLGTTDLEKLLKG